MDRRELLRAKIDGGPIIQIEGRFDEDRETDVSITEALSFEGVTDAIKALSTSVTDALRSARPDRATVEFGLDIGVESGGLTALIVKGKGTATLLVTLEWERAADPA